MQEKYAKRIFSNPVSTILVLQKLHFFVRRKSMIERVCGFFINLMCATIFSRQYLSYWLIFISEWNALKLEYHYISVKCYAETWRNVFPWKIVNYSREKGHCNLPFPSCIFIFSWIWLCLMMQLWNIWIWWHNSLFDLLLNISIFMKELQFMVIKILISSHWRCT